jgi:hypothetical protein
MALLQAFEAYLETLEEYRRLTVRRTKKWLCWLIEFGVCDEGLQILIPP